MPTWLGTWGRQALAWRGHRAAVRRMECLAESGVPTYTADGRTPLGALYGRYVRLCREYGWRARVVHELNLPAGGTLPIVALATPRAGPAVWVLAGIHGEEPAGPNAIAAQYQVLGGLAAMGIPVVLFPLCNPVGYALNWRYPNTPHRTELLGGVSVGDADHLLPAADHPDRARRAAPVSEAAAALTAAVLRLAKTYPPVLVCDHHEDEQLAASYVYARGMHEARAVQVAGRVVELLQQRGIPLQRGDATRFGEPIHDGVITRGADGLPIPDGSVDELLTSARILCGGRNLPGPAAPVSLVIETPTIGVPLAQRVAAHADVLHALPGLWRVGCERCRNYSDQNP